MTHGARYLAERDQNFQKLLAFYPYWNNSPVWDNYELNRQVAKATGVLPDFDKALISPEEQAARAAQQAAAQGAAPGGMASEQDMTNGMRSRSNTTMQRRPQANPVTGAF